MYTFMTKSVAKGILPIPTNILFFTAGRLSVEPYEPSATGIT